MFARGLSVSDTISLPIQQQALKKVRKARDRRRTGNKDNDDHSEEAEWGLIEQVGIKKESVKNPLDHSQDQFSLSNGKMEVENEICLK